MFCGFWAWLFEASDQAFSTPIKKWLVQRWLDSTYEDVFQITDDEVVAVIREPKLDDFWGTMSCAGAGAIQVFGTDRSYDEVVEDYALWAKKKGWKTAELPDDVKAEGVFEIKIPENRYTRWFDTFQYFYVSPYEPEESVDFETVYKVELRLGEPRCRP